MKKHIQNILEATTQYNINDIMISLIDLFNLTPYCVVNQDGHLVNYVNTVQVDDLFIHSRELVNKKILLDWYAGYGKCSLKEATNHHLATFKTAFFNPKLHTFLINKIL